MKYHRLAKYINELYIFKSFNDKQYWGKDTDHEEDEYTAISHHAHHDQYCHQLLFNLWNRSQKPWFFDGFAQTKVVAGTGQFRGNCLFLDSTLTKFRVELLASLAEFYDYDQHMDTINKSQKIAARLWDSFFKMYKIEYRWISYVYCSKSVSESKSLQQLIIYLLPQSKSDSPNIVLDEFEILVSIKSKDYIREYITFYSYCYFIKKMKYEDVMEEKWKYLLCPPNNTNLSVV